MNKAAKHFDPQVGIDIHTYSPPPIPAPVPTLPLPTPHIGIVFDPSDYLPTIHCRSDNPVLGAAETVLGGMANAAEAISGESMAAPKVPNPPNVGEGWETEDQGNKGEVTIVPFPLGATTTVNGVWRANAGTAGMCFHIFFGTPMPAPMAPCGPQRDDELFMGSRIVGVDSQPFSRFLSPVLACNIVGIPSPIRPKKGLKFALSLLLPTVVNIGLPNSVFIGGSQTISWMAQIMRAARLALAGLKGLSKLGLSKIKRLQNFIERLKGSEKGWQRMLGNFLCQTLIGHPVDILTGEVVMPGEEDFTLPGRIPIEWVRSYASGNDYQGLCGHGWETPADARLEIDPADGIVCMRHPSVGPLYFAGLPGTTGDEAGELELMDGALLTDHGDELRIRTKQDLIYHFPKVLGHVGRDGQLLCPIGSITDLCGNRLDFERRDGVLTAINESAGRRIEFDVVDGRIQEVSLAPSGTDSRHVFVRYKYDNAGDLVAVVDALGHSQHFAYDQHHLVRHTNRNGLSFYFEYDKSGEKWRSVHTWGDGGVYDYKLEYVDALNERRITDSLGHTTVMKLDDDGLPICVVDPLGAVTVLEYDDVGRTVAVTAPEGLRTSFDYDAYGNMFSTTLPDGSTVSAVFNEDHKPVSMTDPEGGRWIQEWDARGNLTRQTAPSGTITQYGYNGQGDLLHVTDPAGQRTTLDYDPLGFLAGLTDAKGQHSQFQHDAQGNLLAKQLANGDTTRYRYDAKNRLVENQLPNKKYIHCAYDPEDNLTRYQDEAGRETLFTYYCQGSLQSRTDPDGSKVEYHFDTKEQLIGVTNQHGKRWHLKRDAAGRLIEETDYWGQARQYGYDAAGYLSKTTDPLGQILSITCDELGRIIRKQASESEAETYRYNKRGQLTEAKNQSSKIERKYNKDGQITKEKQQQSGIDADIVYFYNPAGQLIEQTQKVEGNRGQTPISQTQRYTYDALGQPDSVQIDKHEPIRFTFDSIGRLTHQQQNQHLAQHYQYNKAGQLTNQANTFKGQLQTRIDYDYDDDGNLISRHDHRTGTDEYRYDLLGQITFHTDPTGKVRQFVYDKTGDRFKTCQETKEGRTLQHPDDSYWLLDKAGQLIRKRDAQGQETSLEWDAFGRLRSLTPSFPTSVEEGGEEGKDRYEYRYDALGRRVCKAKAANPLRNTPSEVTWFVWDGDVMVGEVKQRAKTTNEGADVGWIELANPNGSSAQPEINWQAQFYSYHLGSFVPLAMQVQKAWGEGGGKSLYFYQNDLNGMPLRLTNENGIITWEAHYTAFGLVDWLGTEQVVQPLRLQGQYFDLESGLHYNRYRYYDARIGCFISQDPIRLLGGENLYQFAPNVLGWSDPLGLAAAPGPQPQPQPLSNWGRPRLPRIPKYQIQHLIPQQFIQHDFLKLAQMNGRKMQHDNRNLMHLPTAPNIDPNPRLGLHNGWTAKHAAYNRMVGMELDDLFAIAQKEGWTTKRARKEYRMLMTRLRRGFRTGLYTCA